jgi:hypothetical protein
MRKVIVLCTLCLAACTTDGTASGTPIDAGPAGPPTPVVLASNQVRPWAVAVDADNVYWVNAGTLGAVFKLPKAGGTATPLYEGPMGGVESLGLDTSAMYLPIAQENRIVALPLGGGPPRTIATTSVPAGGVALANGSVWWVERAGDLMAPPVAKRVATTGGNVETIDLPTSPRIASPYFTVAGPDAVYVSLHVAGILRIPFDGTSPATVAPVQAQGLAVDADRIFFAASDTLSSVAKTGGEPKPLVPVQFPFGVAADDTHVYFTDTRPVGKIMKVAKAGGPATVLAERQGAAHGIAVDETSVYWTAIDDGTVNKISK